MGTSLGQTAEVLPHLGRRLLDTSRLHRRVLRADNPPRGEAVGSSLVDLCGG